MNAKNSPELSIVMPAYNEEKRIGETLKRVGSYFAGQNEATYSINGKIEKIPSTEILVVINNTTDRTQEIVNLYEKKYPFIRSVNIPMKTDKGGAVAIGFKLARGKYTAFMDADGSSSPREVMKLYKAMIATGADGAIANRYTADSLISGNMPLMRTIYSRLFNFAAVRVLFRLNYSDTQCGLKMFKSEVAKELSTKIVSLKWTIDLNMLLLAKYLGMSIIEVPTVWIYKQGSTLNARKAMVSVPQEIIRLKWNEMKTDINRAKKFMRIKRDMSGNENDLLSEKWYPWAGYMAK